MSWRGRTAGVIGTVVALLAVAIMQGTGPVAASPPTGSGHLGHLGPARQESPRQASPGHVSVGGHRPSAPAPLPFHSPPGSRGLSRALSPAPIRTVTPSLPSLAAASASSPGVHTTRAFVADTAASQCSSYSDQCGVLPPDTNLAVGGGWLVEATNNALSFWPAAAPGASPQYVDDLSSFLADSTESNYNEFSDPRIVFDSLAGRWLLSMLLYDPSNYNSEVALATSETADPTGLWYVYYLPSDASSKANDFLADQPKVGFSSDAVEVAWNGFSGSGTTFAGAVLDAVPTGPLFSGASFFYAIDQGSAAGDENSLMPAISMTPTVYAWASYSDTPTSGSSFVGSIYFDGTPSSSNFTFGSETRLTTSSFVAPPLAAQPDSTASIATNDNRLLSAVWDAGVIWTAANDGCTPSTTLEACLRVISITTPANPSAANPTLGQDYDLSAPAADLYFPALALDAAGDLMLSYTESSSSSSGYPSAELAFIPSAELSSATTPTDITSVTVFSGASSYYPPCGSTCEEGGGYRWGDYSGAATDPQNPAQVWVAAEFAQAPPANSNACELTSPTSTDTGCWSTAIGEFHDSVSYTPLPPDRICDTRTGQPANQCTGKTLGPGGILTVQVAGEGGVPGRGASAVVANVTGIAHTHSTVLTVYPFGDLTPNASNLNLVTGEVVPNLVVATLGPGGAIEIKNGHGSTDVIVDVEGYYALPTSTVAGDYFNPLPPSRICDTRPSQPANQCTGKTVGPGETLQVQVTGNGGVPSGAVGFVANVTITNTTASSFLTIWPADGSQPNASNLNWVRGETIPNRVEVPLSSSGAVDIYNSKGTVAVIVDVNGYYSSASAATYVPLSPARICDTRTGQPANQCTGHTLGSKQKLTVQVTGNGGVPSSATAVVVNVTVTDTTADSFLTVWPADVSQPNASDLNWTRGETTPNLVVVQLSSSGTIDVYNLAGSTAVIVDVAGYFG